MDIFLTVLFGIVGLSSLVFAIREGKRAKRAEKKLVKLEQAMISHKYLKEKAFDYYNNGNYDDSLDVFKKYLLNNKNESEWKEIIGYIFINETKKMYSGLVVFDGGMPNITMLIQAYISYEEKQNNFSSYPEIIKILISDYGETFGKTRVFSKFFMALFDKDWENAKVFLSNIALHRDDDLSELFRQYVLKYLNKKLGIIDDGHPVYDIPF